MKKFLNILIGGLGYKSLIHNQWKNSLFLESHSNQFLNLPDNIIKISSQSEGCGGDMYCGQEEFKKIKEEVLSIVNDYDYVVITAGFGGGTGSGFTLGLIELLEQNAKSYIIIANTLKKDEYYKVQSISQYDLIIQTLDRSCLYVLIDSKQIEKELCLYDLKANEYEKYFSNQNIKLIETISSIVEAGIDLKDIKETLKSGLTYFSYSSSESNNIKYIADNLFFDKFSKIKTRHIDNYILSYTNDITQNHKNYLLERIDQNTNSTSFKTADNYADIYCLIGGSVRQQTVTNSSTNDLAYGYKQAQTAGVNPVYTQDSSVTNSLAYGYKQFNKQSLDKIFWL